MPVVWSFRSYVSARGVDEIKAWYDTESGKVQGKFLSRLKVLRQWPGHQWKPPYFRWLSGECDELGEIRFEVARVQHRPLGYQGPGQLFTLTICAQESNDRFVPPGACT